MNAPREKLKTAAAAALLGMSPPKFRRVAVSDPTFPAAFVLGPKLRCYLRCELLAWLAAQQEKKATPKTTTEAKTMFENIIEDSSDAELHPLHHSRKTPAVLEEGDRWVGAPELLSGLKTDSKTLFLVSLAGEFPRGFWRKADLIDADGSPITATVPFWKSSELGAYLDDVGGVAGFQLVAQPLRAQWELQVQSRKQRAASAPETSH